MPQTKLPSFDFSGMVIQKLSMELLTIQTERKEA